ncbi:plasmid SOS inhibition protein A (plasmid) [Escherichia coli]|nr:plasmid SOS inhibition protein A [Escherichia coli]
MPAGVTGWQSMTWKPCSGSGVSVFPSLAGMERWQWQDMPFWQVIAEASLAAREAGHAVREMERWMVPNKLREAGVMPATIAQITRKQPE